MKKLILTVSSALCVLAASLVHPVPSLAWLGFDAASADVVEVSPDALPRKGDVVDVRDVATDAVTKWLVEDVRRNIVTVELTMKDTEGKSRILVMDGF